MTAIAPDLSRKTAWAWLVATFFGIGRLNPGPGTWASVATVLLWRALAPFTGSLQVAAAIVAATMVTLIGIPASTRVARESKLKDPGFVVIDEVAGQLIALVGAPLVWRTLLASLILFRVFDIVKPPPLRLLEKIPDGAGIMLDDVGAGLYALAVIQGLRHFGLLP
ncbi:MAG: phosphatidylglycerophosphatase A family protein [Terriglobales bacterium]